LRVVPRFSLIKTPNGEEFKVEYKPQGTGRAIERNPFNMYAYSHFEIILSCHENEIGDEELLTESIPRGLKAGSELSIDFLNPKKVIVTLVEGKKKNVLTTGHSEAFVVCKVAADSMKIQLQLTQLELI
jgi:hypothetical protein